MASWLKAGLFLRRGKDRVFGHKFFRKIHGL
jgi:hypothetical protein